MIRIVPLGIAIAVWALALPASAEQRICSGFHRLPAETARIFVLGLNEGQFFSALFLERLAEAQTDPAAAQTLLAASQKVGRFDYIEEENAPNDFYKSLTLRLQAACAKPENQSRSVFEIWELDVAGRRHAQRLKKLGVN